MSAYKDALHVEFDASKGRILGKQIALRPEPDRILCEVIEGPHEPGRSPQEYESLVDAAREYLNASPLGDAIAKRKLEWLVVADRGTGTVELWPLIS